MNEKIKQIFDNAKTQFLALPKQRQIFAGIGVGAVVLGLIAMSTLIKRDPFQVLYSDLRPEEIKNVSKKLGEQNISFQLSEDSSTIMVPASQVYQARMELAKEGLPGQDLVGFEKFDGSTIGMSSYVQRIQYIRAVQGELTRSIQRLASVKSARVHISVPPKKTFLEEEDPPKASVVMELKSGMTLSKSEVTGVAHLVASAVEGLKVNQITIVDTKGNFLHRPEQENNTAIPTAFLEMQRSIESEYERRIEEMLTPVVGFGKVRAKVTAEIDPSRVNTTEETFDPDKVVARTLNKTDESNSGSRPNPMGIPGSRSNLPGAEVTTPPVPMATSSNEKNSSNASYAIPRKIQVIDKPSGSIKRLTVAVVVDGNYAKAPDSPTEVFSPRTEEELRRIQELVANAVGFDAQRRDSINVSSMPFKGADIEIQPKEDLPVWNLRNLQSPLLRNGLIALVLLSFVFLVMRPFVKWLISKEKDSQLETALAFQPQTIEQLETAVKNGIEIDSMIADSPSQSDRTNEELLAQMQENEEKENVIRDLFKETESKKEEKQLRNLILEQLEKSPKKGFRVIQEWLEEDSDKKLEEEAA